MGVWSFAGVTTADRISPPSELLITQLTDEDIDDSSLIASFTGASVKLVVKKEIVGKKRVVGEKEIVEKKYVVEEETSGNKEVGGKKEVTGIDKWEITMEVCDKLLSRHDKLKVV
ncbi:hypothetical protein L1987_65023 [Smallanthus sonchifolius]|uniref:Uncharacterized protein n=1 Tax=Smallanthus sonchifolius TaxID=185202 RepID=A0ACB9BTC2_9ASTR|nr:hypothetical protein L1987_65023 [Smallanthus sonchifolius]